MRHLPRRQDGQSLYRFLLVLFVAGTTALSAAILNQVIAGVGSKLGIRVLYARISYNGSAWQVVSSVDSCGLTSGNLAWSTNKLLITLSNFTAAPVVLVSLVSSTSTRNLDVDAHATSSSNIDVTFRQTSDGTLVSTQATTMDFNIFVIGAQS